MEKSQIKEILIEVCQSCSTHRWCTRHDETKYNGLFEEVKKEITTLLGPDILVLKNKNIQKPQIGAFEVKINSILVFSKIKSGLFPIPLALAQRIKLFFEDHKAGHDLNKYSTIVEKRFSPQKKQIAQTALDWNAKYEELKKIEVAKKSKNNGIKEINDNETSEKKKEENLEKHEGENNEKEINEDKKI